MFTLAPHRLYLACTKPDPGAGLGAPEFEFGFYLATGNSALYGGLSPSADEYISRTLTDTPDPRLRALVLLGAVQPDLACCVDGILAAQPVPAAPGTDASGRWAHSSLVVRALPDAARTDDADFRLPQRMAVIGLVPPPVLRPAELLRMARFFARRHAALPPAVRAATPAPIHATDGTPLAEPLLATSGPSKVARVEPSHPHPHRVPSSLSANAKTPTLPCACDMPRPANARHCTIIDGRLLYPACARARAEPRRAPEYPATPPPGPSRQLPTAMDHAPNSHPSCKPCAWCVAEKHRKAAAYASSGPDTRPSWLATPPPAAQLEGGHPLSWAQPGECLRRGLRRQKHVRFTGIVDVDGGRARDGRVC
jgi:hypothetical protein